MNERIELGRYNILPPVVKNLLIINALFYVAKVVLNFKNIDIDLDQLFGLHYVQATDFKIWQVITYMFMHGDFWHLFLICLPFGCLVLPLKIYGEAKNF
jgi:membrane associated rhomboid family serine protease